MSKKKANGEGSITKRADGRYMARYDRSIEEAKQYYFEKQLEQIAVIQAQEKAKRNQELYNRRQERGTHGLSLLKSASIAFGCTSAASAAAAAKGIFAGGSPHPLFSRVRIDRG